MTKTPKKSTKQTTFSKCIDKMTTIVAIATPLLTVPQAYTIFSERSAATVSMSTWVAFNFASIIWSIYAYQHRQWLLLTYQGLFVIIQTVVIIGGILYGAHW